MHHLCPVCHVELRAVETSWECPSCLTHYRLQNLCPSCESELELIRGCGASNWFCPKCNELKSKSAIITRLHPGD